MPQENKSLTLDTPLDEKTIQELEEIDRNHTELAKRLLQLEEAKIEIMLAARPLQKQKDRIWERVFTERGLPLTSSVVLDTDTRKISLME